MLAPRVLLGNRRMPFSTNSLQNRDRKLMEASIGGRTDNTVAENPYPRKLGFRKIGALGNLVNKGDNPIASE